MIDLTKAKEAKMFAETFTADPEHDHFVGPEVPPGQAWELTSLWLRAGQGGLGEAMLGILQDEKFVALASRRSMLDGDSLAWSGDVLMTEGMAILYWTQGARQAEDIACSATWKVLSGVEEGLAALKREWAREVEKINAHRGNDKRKRKGKAQDATSEAKDS